MFELIIDITNKLFPLSGIVALLSTTVGIWLALAEYRLKLRAESRIADSAKIEADINLIKHFTELMNVAHARSGYSVSETVIEKMFENGFFTDDDKNNLEILNQKLEDAAILTLPVGLAAQDAAMAAISVLAKKHDILKKPALQALESMKFFKKELSEKYITEINASN